MRTSFTFSTTDVWYPRISQMGILTKLSVLVSYIHALNTFNFIHFITRFVNLLEQVNFCSVHIGNGNECVVQHIKYIFYGAYLTTKWSVESKSSTRQIAVTCKCFWEQFTHMFHRKICNLWKIWWQVTSGVIMVKHKQWKTFFNYSDVIKSAMASQITGVSLVCTTVCLGADQRKDQSSALLVFVGGIQRWPVGSPHKGPVTRKKVSFDDVIMCCCC